MNTFKTSLLLSCLLLFLSIVTIGQGRKEKMTNSPLFQDTSILEITLKTELDPLITDITVREDHPGTLIYKDESGSDVEIPLKLKVRGKTRANPKVCSFPPLRLDFKKKGNDDNIFAGQNKIKLVDHCQGGKSYEQYLLQEYLLYKLYNLVSDYSLRVRLLKVNYVDTQEKIKPFTRYAFLIEDIEALAYRTNMYEGGKVNNQDRCDKGVLDVLTVFQYMIGNTDWGVGAGHNIKLIARDTTYRVPIPVPYDFDYSGAIGAHYARPAPDLPIENVKIRLFRGYCRQPGTYEKVFEVFNANKDKMYSLYNDFGRLDEKKKKAMIKYLDAFFDTINNPKKADRAIIKTCEVNHRHVY